MPSFFLPEGGKAAKRKSAVIVKKGGKRNKKDNSVNEKEERLSRKKRLMANTEIASDEEEDSIGNNLVESGGSEDEYDDAHERGYRQAKELLAKLESGKKEDEDLGELLKEDAAQRAGTLQKHLADLAEIKDEEEISHKGHRFSPLCVAISPCKKFVVSSGKESRIIKYSIEQRQIVGMIRRTKNGGNDQQAHFGHIFAVAISNDGKLIASGGFDGVVKIWDFATLTHLRNLTGHRASITALCFQMKTNNLFSASRDRSVKLWDLDQMGLIDTMYGHQDAVVAISSLQKQIVVTAGAQDRSCRMWKVEDESQLIFSGNSNCIRMDCVAMLTDTHFVSGSTDGSLCLWSVMKKKPLVIRRQIHGCSEAGEARWIVSVAAIPYSDLVATGSNDGDVKLWKIASDYKKITQVFAYCVDGFINSLSFSQDGRLLAIGVGKEHKDGRWWIDKEAKNQVVILPLHYGDTEEIAENGPRLTVASDSEDEDDVEEN